MKNVTVTMEDCVADWARLEAARRNTSVSRLVGEMLADKMRHDDAYERAYWTQRDLNETWRYILFNGGGGVAGAGHAIVRPMKEWACRPCNLIKRIGVLDESRVEW